MPHGPALIRRGRWVFQTYRRVDRFERRHTRTCQSHDDCGLLRTSDGTYRRGTRSDDAAESVSENGGVQSRSIVTVKTLGKSRKDEARGHVRMRHWVACYHYGGAGFHSKPDAFGNEIGDDQTRRLCTLSVSVRLCRFSTSERVEDSTRWSSVHHGRHCLLFYVYRDRRRCTRNRAR